MNESRSPLLIFDEQLLEQRAYWLGQLAPVSETPAGLPVTSAPSGGASAAWQHLSMSLPLELSERLRKLASGNAVLVHCVLTTVTKIVLFRYTGQAVITIGTPHRHSTGENGSAGEALTVVDEVVSETSFRKLLEGVRNTLADAHSNSRYPFSRLLQDLQRTGASLFDVTVAVDSLHAEMPDCGQSLDLRWSESDGRYCCDIMFRPARYTASAVEQFAGHLQQVLESCMANPQRPIRTLPLLTAAERQVVLQDWSGAGATFAVASGLAERFASQAKRTPLAVAVGDGVTSLTYAELDARSNQLAQHLRGLGVGSESLVGLCLERSVSTVVGILGILKAGGAYLPLDPAYPADRLAFMLEDSQTRVVVTEAGLKPVCAGSTAQLVCLDTDAELIAQEPTSAPPITTDPHQAAYVIYTSGSTGKPKGCVVTHANVLRLFDGTDADYHFDETDVWTLFHSFAFDFSVWELWGALLYGGRLVVVPYLVSRSPMEFRQLLSDEQVTVLNQTPSAFLQLMDADAQTTTKPLALKWVIFGGEALQPAKLDPWFDRYGDQRPTLVNMYGITETTVHVTFQPLTKESAYQGPASPIGRALPDLQLYLLDAALEPVPVGVPGELYVGGAGVARGYLNRPGLTATRFVPHPFSKTEGTRLYRTGDQARWLTDGTLDFLGRIDQQVKIRGFRIELGEIEAVLAKHPALRQAAVIARQRDDGQPQLLAYVVPQDANTTPTVDELRQHLQGSLPDYMLPAHFVTLEQLPLTTNGKLDARALPDPAHNRTALAGDFVAPRNEIETTLATIWQDLLHLEHVGVNDNFFALGGDSILSIQVVSRIRAAGYDCTPVELFQHQTVAQLATVVRPAVASLAEQGPVIGPLPLAPIQHWFLDPQPTAPQHFNQSLLFEVQGAIDVAALETALAAIVAQHDALRLIVTQHEGVWSQQLGPVTQTSALSVCDLTTTPVAEQVAQLEEECAATQASLDLASGFLFRAVYFQMGADRPGRLLLVIHHFAVDGVSWRILLEDLSVAYQQALRGQNVALPAKTASVRQWDTNLAAFATTPTVLDQVDYWRTLQANAFQAQFPLAHPEGVNRIDQVRQAVRMLDAAQTEALLRDVPSVYHTQINDVLLAALADAYQAWSGRERLLVDLEGHGREDLFPGIDVSRTVGWFTSLYPVLLETSANDDPGTRLKTVKEQLRNVPLKGLSYGLLRYLGPDDIRAELAAGPQANVSFNYLGQVDRGMSDPTGLLRGAAESRGHERDPSASRTHAIDITARISAGRLRMIVHYGEALSDADEIDRFADAYLTALVRLIDHCREPGAGGYTTSDFPLAEIPQPALDALAARLGPLEDLYPLTSTQEGLAFLTRLAPEAGAYVIQQFGLLEGPLDVSALRTALEQVAQRHTLLRTSFHWDGLPRPLQAVQARVHMPLVVEDWSHESEASQQSRWEQLLAEDQRQGFELSQSPLARFMVFALGQQRFRFLWSHHHILLDGWSLPILLKEVFTFYEMVQRGIAIDLPQPRPFRDYVDWLKHQNPVDAEAYWQRRLGSILEPNRLGIDNGSRTTDSEFAERMLTISAARTEQLEAFARERQVTFNTLIQAAWAILLSRYSGRSEVVFGETVSGRTAPLSGIDRMVGPFINTLPVRVDLPNDVTLTDWLQSLQRQAGEQRQFEHSPLVEVQRASGVAPGTPLFEYLYVFENFPMDRNVAAAGQMTIQLRELDVAEHTSYPLTCVVMPKGELRVRLVYATSRFASATIDQLLGHMERLLEAFTENPRRRLSEISLLSEAERRRFLVEWNRSGPAFPTEKCLHTWFEEQVQQTPSNTAVVSAGQSLNYAELNGRANQLARELLARGVEPGTLVGLCVHRSPAMVIGMLGILKAGCAYVPLDPEYPAERLAGMLADADLQWIVTTSDLTALLPPETAQVCIDESASTVSGRDADNLPCVVSPENRLYAIFTSGSTGRPKLAAVKHAGFVNLLSWFCRDFGYGPAERTLVVTSFSFDLTQKNFFAPLVTGGQLHLLPVGPFDPASITALIARQQITRLNTTPSGMYPLVEAVPDHAARLASLRYVFLGGEPIVVRRLAGWLQSPLSQAELVNTYGPTECTDICCGYTLLKDAVAAHGDKPFPIGPSIPGAEIYVLDPQMQLLPFGALGELYVGGVGVGDGYLNDCGLTAARFVCHPFSSEPGSRLYRTGDQVRWLSEGTLEFLGRIDQQVKIRGFRIELGEIESVLGRHPSVREAAVIDRADASGQKRLVAYVVAREEHTSPSIDALRSHLQTRLPDYMVPSAFLILNALPLTPNGKLNRKALPEPELSRQGMTAEFVAPRNAIEETLAGIWQELLGVDRVGVHDNFFVLGGHSLLVTQVISRVREKLAVDLPLRELFDKPTIATMALLIEQEQLKGLTRSLPPIIRADRAGLLPLSFAQERLWFLDQLVPDNPFYNIPRVVRLRGALNFDALQQTLDEIIRRHEPLRTTIATEAGRGVQCIWPASSLSIPLVDLTDWEPTERETEARRLVRHEAQQPFNLAQGPLVRALVIRLAPDDHVVFWLMHHIVSDGWSMGVLNGEVAALYGAFAAGKPSPLPELPIQYADFALWQRSWLDGPVLDEQVEYWRKQLADLPPLALPTDRPRPALQTYRGNSVSLPLSAELRDGLNALSRREGVTLFMTMLGLFKVLLSRYSGQQDIVVSSPIAGRTHRDLEGLIGFFVNSLVLRTDLSGSPTVSELLGRLRETCLGAYAHQDLPYEKLVFELQPQRDLSREPLTQVAFVLQNAPKANVPLSKELTLSLVDMASDTTRIDLEVHVWEHGDAFELHIEYSADIFDHSTIERMAGHYQRLLEAAVRNPEALITRLEMLDDDEQRRLLTEWNPSLPATPQCAGVQELFEQQAERTPTNTAVQFGKQRVTYAELNARANQLARYLRELEVHPETLVAISVDRGPAMIVGLLGILKAGGASVPIDPDLPLDRRQFMLQDSRAAVLITQKSLLKQIPCFNGEIVLIDDHAATIEQYSPTSLPVVNHPRHPAYVIYTSGSTGTPKGVVVDHDAITRHVTATVCEYGLSPKDRVLQFAATSFDQSMEQILPTLAAGATVFVRGSEVWSGDQLWRTVQDEALTIIDIPSAYFHQTLDALTAFRNHASWPLRLVIVGGDVIPIEAVRLWQQSGVSNARVLNAYGPTEATITATLYDIPLLADDHTLSTIPIGRPVANTRVYVLDPEMQPQPLGAAGELYLGGATLARGYLHRPALTAERFVPNPFGDGSGERLYRTGDLVRWLTDGQLEFLGRVDQQVKIRGFRIELGEIETALTQHSAVREAVVFAREDQPGQKRLVAYVVPQSDATEQLDQTDEATDQIDSWQSLYDEMYAGTTADDLTFNTVGWESSYTGEPIPAAEMQVFRDSRVEQILSLKPQRVLEIGCGTGLLLLKIAPHCEACYGTDFSQPVLDSLAAAVKRQQLTNVTLLQRYADDFDGLDPHSFDVVVLNSVIQYFPSVEYLIDVLRGAMRLLRPGGAIFIGDVRNLQLWEAFHADVRQTHARTALSTVELQQMIRARLAQEKELLVDPAFFHAFVAQSANGGAVEISLERGAGHNELNQFRYDVLLHVDAANGPHRDIVWNDWQAAPFTLESLTQQLHEEQPDVRGYRSVSNARVIRAVKVVEALSAEDVPGTVGELRSYVAAHTPETIDPEDLWLLAKSCGYRAHITWSCLQPGTMDIVLQKNGVNSPVAFSLPAGISTRPLISYANQPLRGLLSSELMGVLRSYLHERLPSYMVPSAFVFLDELPLTANGKIDRRALPAPSVDRPELSDFVAPRNETENILAEIWAEIIGLDRVGVNDNFFELGGDSILSIQVVSRIRARGLNCTPLQMFQNQTIDELARVLVQSTGFVAVQGSVTGPVRLSPIQQWFLESEPLAPHHFNQSFLFEVHGWLDPVALEACLQTLVAHHDALRLTVARSGETWTQFSEPVNSQSCLSMIDLRDVSDEDLSEVIEQRCAAIQASLKLTAGVLLHGAYFDLGKQRSGRLLLVVHHFAVDGVSWRILLEDLYALYRQRTGGKPFALPPKTTSFQEWMNRLADSAHIEVLAAEAPYWLRQHEAAASAVFPVDHPRGANTVASAKRVTQQLDEATTQALLREVPAVYHTQINDVLLAALVDAHHTWTGHDRLLLDLEGHGREELFADVDLSRTVGWFTSLFPVLLQSLPQPDAGALLKSVKEQLRALSNQGIGYGVLRYLGTGDVSETLRQATAPQIVFNYLGQIDRGLVEQTDLFSTARESRGPERPLNAARPYLVEVSAFIAGGRLQLAWEYSANVHDRVTIERLAEAYVASLQRIIEHCLQPGTGGYTPSDFPLAKIDQPRLDALAARVGRIEDLYPLTPTQEGLMFHTLMEPDSGVYVLQQHGLLEGELDSSAMALAWRLVMERHDLLRTSFETEGLERPLQVVHPSAPLPLIEHDWSDLSVTEQQARWTTLLAEDRNRNFDLSRPPLMRLIVIRLGANAFRFIWSQHHLLSDGWSQPKLLQEVFLFYESARQGRTLILPKPRPFRDYVALLEQQDQREAAKAWQTLMDGFAEPVRIGIDRGPSAAVPDIHFEMGGLSVEDTLRAEVYAREHQVTLNTLVQAAFALVLARYSDRDDVVFGETVSGRSADLSGVETLIGPTISTLPVRVKFASATPVKAWIKDLQRQSAELHQYEAYPLVQIQGFSQVPVGTPLFEYLYIFQNQPPTDFAAATSGLSVKVREMGVEEVNSYPLTFVAVRRDRLGFRFSYDRHRFAAGDIRQLLTHLAEAIRAIIADPLQSVDRLDILSAVDVEALTAGFNSTVAEYPRETCIHTLFEEQAARTPDNVAVLFEQERLNYGELNIRANRWAHELRRRGIGAESLVAICCERSPEMVVALLATLKAGAAYLPLDPDYPLDRLASMLDDSHAELLLVSPAQRSRFPDYRGMVISLDVDPATFINSSPQNRLADITSSTPAYVIYTSGSTGQPKGVVVEHRSVVNHLTWMQHHCPLTASDRILQRTAFSFDAAVWEFYLPLCIGSAVVLAPGSSAEQLDRMAELLDQYEITVFHGVPTLLRALVENRTLLEARTLRHIFSGGEPLTADLVERMTAAGLKVHNVYGPTETTMNATAAIDIDAATLPITIGPPISNTQAYVLDAHLRVSPMGVPGELYLAGDGLARGYLRKPELTAERFVPNPFGQDGARMYRTGDQARWLSNGELECLGRIDHQVKVRGYRIELGEIEAVLSEAPNVQAAAVVARSDSSGQKRLVAYIVGQPNVTASTTDGLRQFVAERLPEYMVPSAFISLDALPLSPNGKVNRRALPQDNGGVVSTGVYEAPRTPLEEALTKIFAEVLHQDRVSIADNFFHLGGHSLLAMMVTAKIHQQLGRKVGVKALFQHGSVKELAAALDGKSRPGVELPLVLLQAGGDRTPLFLIHPPGGSVGSYLHLARGFATERSIYGLQAPGLEGEAEPLTTVEAMAECYVNAIRKVQPHGPYCVAGWSAGGFIAKEMAQRWQAEGEPIGLLAMLDAPARPLGTGLHEAFWEQAPLLFANLARDLLESLGVPLLIPVEELAQHAPTEQVERILSVYGNMGIPLPEELVQHARRLPLMLKITLEAGRNYQPRFYHGSVTLFSAADRGATEADNDLLKDWKQAAAAVEFIPVVGSHHSMVLDPDHARRLAEQMQQCLRRVERISPGIAVESDNA